MRFLFALSLVSVVAAAATFACSSSNPATPAADAGKDAKATQTTGDDDDDQPSETQDSGGNTTPDDDAGDTDAGTDAPTTGNGGDGGAACKAGMTAEVEPNDTEAAATVLAQGKTFAFCGTTTSGDTDIYTFTTPDFDNSFGATPSGDNVNYKFQIGNKTFDGFPQNGFGNINVGDKWTITVKTGSANARAYALKIEFK